jgi:predicted ABC-type ATPase
VKDIVILAGPNGAGKTTAARKLLVKFPQVREFLNADEFAREITPASSSSASLAAGRKMLTRMRQLVELGESFGFESTLSGRTYASFLKNWKRAGWRIIILFLWLPTPEDAIDRVKKRVLAGGHDIPPADIRRRYNSGLANLLALYIPLADELEVYDNSYKRALIASRREGGILHLWDMKRWQKLKRAARRGR